MLLSDAVLKPYTDTAYHNEKLKSLSRYRFDAVRFQAGVHPLPRTKAAGSDTSQGVWLCTVV